MDFPNSYATSVAHEASCEWDLLLDIGIHSLQEISQFCPRAELGILPIFFMLQNISVASRQGTIDPLANHGSNSILNFKGRANSSDRLSLYKEVFLKASMLQGTEVDLHTIPFIGTIFIKDWYPALYRTSHLRRMDPIWILYQCPLIVQSSSDWTAITRRYAHLVVTHLNTLSDGSDPVTDEELTLVGLYALIYTFYATLASLTLVLEKKQVRTTKAPDAFMSLIRFTLEGS